MPRAGKSKLNYSKCRQCRHDKQKCLPVDRIWPNKCDRCKKYGYNCSENCKADGNAQPQRHPTKSTNECLRAISLCMQIEYLRESRNVYTGVRDPELESLLLGELVFDDIFRAVFNDCQARAEEVEREGRYYEAEMIYQHLLPFIEKVPNFTIYEHMELVLKLSSLQERRGDVWAAQNTLLSFCESTFETLIEKCVIYDEPAPKVLATLSTISHGWAEASGQVSASLFRGGRILSPMVHRTILSTNLLHKLPLELAALGGFEDVVRKILGNCSKVYLNRSTCDSIVVSLCAAAWAGYGNVAQLLLEIGAGNFELKFRSGFRDTPPIFLAAKKGHEGVIRLLLGAGVEANFKQYDGNTALIEAVKAGHESAVRLLLNAGADINSKDKSGWTALTQAAYAGHESIVQILLGAGAEVNSKDISGATALIQTAVAGHESIIRLLLDAGAEVNYNTYGRTALMVAAEAGSEVVVRLLLDAGAEVNYKTSSGRTALMIAAKAGSEVVVRLLLDAGAEVNCKTSPGRTALMVAAEAGSEAVVRLLLDAGA